MIRAIRADEYEPVGQLCLDAYVIAGVADATDPYTAFLADIAARDADPLADVLVLEKDSRVLGTVTLCRYGSALTEIAAPGELEVRALAVAQDAQRQGVAQDLIWAAADWAREFGYDTLTICVTRGNAPAHSLYEKLGFVRHPERDWVAPDSTPLQTYTFAATATRYCPRCGRERHVGDHLECAAALELEPPRYCPFCRRRMVVQVVPTGWRSTCSKHGEHSG